MVEGDLNADPSLDEVHLPLAQRFLIGGEEPRLVDPPRWSQPFAEEPIDRRLSSGGRPLAFGLEGSVHPKDVFARDRSRRERKFAPGIPILEDLAGVTEIVSGELHGTDGRT